MFLASVILFASGHACHAQSSLQRPVLRPKVAAAGNPEQLPLRGLTPADVSAIEKFDSVVDEATKSSGATFVGQDKVFVKAPMLSALITLNDKLSPYQLDSRTANEISLADVLQTAFTRNLDIRIAGADAQTKHWLYRSTLGGFLPNLINEVSYQYINGTYVSPVGLAIPIKNPYLTMNSELQWYVFKGGGILFAAKQAQHQYKASSFGLKGTINDVLQDAAKLYYNLVLNDALLQIRVKAVEVSRALLIVNQDQFDNGVNTQLDVLQAKYQLSEDRQKLIKQQVARRQAAINLATAINIDQGIDLSPKDRLINKLRLVDASLAPADLLQIALDNRPELKRYDQLRLAAKDAIKVARSTLFPTVAGNGQIIGSGTRLKNLSSNNSSAATPLSASGAGIGSITSASSLPISGSSSSGARSWSTRSLMQIGVDMQWNLGGLAWTELAQIQAARSEARKAQYEFMRSLMKIQGEVRDAYLSSLRAEQLIVETNDAVSYAEEGLRLAEVRFKEGVGTYLDVITQQRNYTTSLIDKANAIIDFNTAQVVLVHALGRPSVQTLTSSIPLRK